MDRVHVMVMSDEVLTEARQQAEARGLFISAIASPVFKCALSPERPLQSGDTFGQQEEDVAAHFTKLERALDIASLLGTSRIRIFSFWREENPQREWEMIISHLREAAAAELALGDVIRVSVPVGAMGAWTRYVIEQVKDEQLLQRLFEGGLKPLSDIFEITKNKEGNFVVPIRIRLAFDPSLMTEGQEPAIHYYDDQQQQWVDMGGTVTESFIEVTSGYLTKFAVLAVDSESAEPEASGEPSGPGEQLTLSDIDRHWAEAEIRKGMQAGYVKGYADGTFQPSRPVTRAEFVVMLMNALQPEGQSTALPDFRDAGAVPDWARPSVSQAVQSGLVQGYEDGSF